MNDESFSFLLNLFKLIRNIFFLNFVCVSQSYYLYAFYYIYSFFEELHDFFSPILLINYIISSLLICMVGIQIVAVSKIFFTQEMRATSYNSISFLHSLRIQVETLHLLQFYFEENL